MNWKQLIKPVAVDEKSRDGNIHMKLEETE